MNGGQIEKTETKADLTTWSLYCGGLSGEVWLHRSRQSRVSPQPAVGLCHLPLEEKGIGFGRGMYWMFLIKLTIFCRFCNKDKWGLTMVSPCHLWYGLTFYCFPAVSLHDLLWATFCYSFTAPITIQIFNHDLPSPGAGEDCLICIPSKPYFDHHCVWFQINKREK